jgi:flagellar basal-body rod protein FlgB
MINRLTDNARGGLPDPGAVLRAERQRLIASNIANADTPGYVARDIDFRQALRRPPARPGAPAGWAPHAWRPSDEAPAAAAAASAGTGAMPLPSQTNLDSNTVDMDRERASFADNAVKYEATLRFINGSVQTMLDAMKGRHNAP